MLKPKINMKCFDMNLLEKIRTSLEKGEVNETDMAEHIGYHTCRKTKFLGIVRLNNCHKFIAEASSESNSFLIDKNNRLIYKSFLELSKNLNNPNLVVGYFNEYLSKNSDASEATV